MKETLVPTTNMSTVAVASSGSGDMSDSTAQAAPAQRQHDLDTAPISRPPPPTGHSTVAPAPMSDTAATPSPPFGTAVPAPPAGDDVGLPAPQHVHSTANPLPLAANSTVVRAPPAEDVVLNRESQWTFGVILTEERNHQTPRCCIATGSDMEHAIWVDGTVGISGDCPTGRSMNQVAPRSPRLPLRMPATSVKRQRQRNKCPPDVI